MYLKAGDYANGVTLKDALKRKSRREAAWMDKRRPCCRTSRTMLFSAASSRERILDLARSLVLIIGIASLLTCSTSSKIKSVEAFSLSTWGGTLGRPAMTGDTNFPLLSLPSLKRSTTLGARCAFAEQKVCRISFSTLYSALMAKIDPDEDIEGWEEDDFVDDDNVDMEVDAIDVDEDAELEEEEDGDGDDGGDDGGDDDDDNINDEMFEEDYKGDQDMEEEEKDQQQQKVGTTKGTFGSIMQGNIMEGSARTTGAASKNLVDWNEEEDGGEYPLEDDPDDPNYQRQKELVEEAMKERRQRPDRVDALDFVMNEMTPEQAQQFELPFFKEVEAKARRLELTEEDVTSFVSSDDDLEDCDILDEPYPRHDDNETNILEQTFGFTDDDMEAFDEAQKMARNKLNEEPWDMVNLKAQSNWNDTISNQTREEMDACLEEIGGSSYNVTNWLVYDLDFNVSNLILAAVKHNPQAPILLQHWYPQLITYERYQHARDRGFDFTMDDVEMADMSELERYYAGFGYPEIPKKAPGETGIIGVDYLDEEELKMAAFDGWFKDVYNEEMDKKDLDDQDFVDEDNVFSEYYVHPDDPDLPLPEEAYEMVKQWQEEIGDDPKDRAYRDRVARDVEYKIVKDEEFERDFRGHLVVACRETEADLDVAEKITLRMEKEFGKQIFVETRIEGLAKEEDNVFEVWLESYDIELLHSKRRATSNTKDWNGPSVCDEKQIDYLVERVGFLISDDARYSYHLEWEDEIS